MHLNIPDNIIQSSRLTEKELKLEIAIMLYQKEKITLGQASELANINQLQYLLII